MADDAELREAARARGFQLVKSRRRKPGGDFGRYGLVGLDSGRECLGFGPDGLTATAEEVLSYLRGGEVASWKRSLIGVVADPDAGAANPKPRTTKEKSEEGTSPAKRDKQEEKDAPEDAKAAPPAPPSKNRASRPKPSAVPPPPPPPPLAIREATRRDAAALAKLLGIPAAPLAERLAAMRDDPPLVADREGPIGIVAWGILPTLQHGPRAHITLLFVAPDARRQGIGTELLQAAEQRLREGGIEAAELSLDIDLDAPNAFLRQAGWERISNGYRKAVG